MDRLRRLGARPHRRLCGFRSSRDFSMRITTLSRKSGTPGAGGTATWRCPAIRPMSTARPAIICWLPQRGRAQGRERRAGFPRRLPGASQGDGAQLESGSFGYTTARATVRLLDPDGFFQLLVCARTRPAVGMRSGQGGPGRRRPTMDFYWGEVKPSTFAGGSARHLQKPRRGGRARLHQGGRATAPPDRRGRYLQMLSDGVGTTSPWKFATTPCSRPNRCAPCIGRPAAGR